MTMMRIHRAMLVPASLLLVLSIAGCGDDSGTNPGPNGGSLEIPASWSGTWQITVQPTTRGGGDTHVEIQTLCAGTSLEELFSDLAEIGLASFGCTGTWNDTAADVQCTASVSYEGCTVTMTMDLDLTRTGDTFTGTQITSVTSEPLGCAGPDEFESVTVTGRRLSTEQFGCGEGLSYTAPASWGGWWSITRIPAGGRPEGGTLVCPDESTPYDVFYPSQGGVSTTGGFTDGSAEVFGSWTEVQGTCLWLYTEKISVTRTGGTLAGTVEQTVHVIGDPNQGGECSDIQQTSYTLNGTRMSEDTTGCGPFTAAGLDLRRLRLF